MHKSSKRAPANKVATSRLRRALLLAAASGLTMDEMVEIAPYATPAQAPMKAVNGSGIRLEKIRMRSPGEIVERLVYRVASAADALTLIDFANRCADAWGYERISDEEAVEILKLYPGNTEELWLGLLVS